MAGRKRVDESRIPGGFVALPWDVLDSPGYAQLSHTAKALLLEVARQYVRDNNGRLLLSMARLKPRGWTSNDVITRAKRELLAAGFLHETVKGMRPNKAGWYALTWFTLDRHSDYDPGAAATFQRGAYRKNTPLTPSGGAGKAAIAPSGGVGGVSVAPSGGAIDAVFPALSTPSHGDHLDMPSPAPKRRGVKGVGKLAVGVGGPKKRHQSGEGI